MSKNLSILKTFKTISATVMFLLFFASANAQTKKGTIALSGKTGLNFLSSNTTILRDSSSTNQLTDNQFGFDVGLGYFVANNFAIGFSGSYSYDDNKFEAANYSPATTETITTTLAVVPQLIYYFPLEGKLKPTLTIGGGYTWLKQRASNITTNNNTTYSLSGPSFNGAAGISYFFTHSVSFDLGLQYSYDKLNDKLNTRIYQKQNTVLATLGVTIFF